MASTFQKDFITNEKACWSLVEVEHLEKPVDYCETVVCSDE